MSVSPARSCARLPARRHTRSAIAIAISRPLGASLCSWRKLTQNIFPLRRDQPLWAGAARLERASQWSAASGGRPQCTPAGWPTCVCVDYSAPRTVAKVKSKTRGKSKGRGRAEPKGERQACRINSLPDWGTAASGGRQPLASARARARYSGAFVVIYVPSRAGPTTAGAPDLPPLCPLFAYVT